MRSGGGGGVVVLLRVRGRESEMGGEVLIGDTALDTFQAVGRNMRCSPVFEEKGTGRVYLL